MVDCSDGCSMEISRKLRLSIDTYWHWFDVLVAMGLDDEYTWHSRFKSLYLSLSRNPA